MTRSWEDLKLEASGEEDILGMRTVYEKRLGLERSFLRLRNGEKVTMVGE